MEINFQVLLLSPNVLKSKVPILGGGHGNPTFVAESKFAKIKSSHFFGGWGGFIEINFQLLLLSPNVLKSKVPFVFFGGGFMEIQLLLLSPNLLKSKVPIFLGEGGFMEINFQVLLLSPNVLKSKVPILGGVMEIQLLLPSPNLLKSKVSFFLGGEGLLKSISNFCC